MQGTTLKAMVGVRVALAGKKDHRSPRVSDSDEEQMRDKGEGQEDEGMEVESQSVGAFEGDKEGHEECEDDEGWRQLRPSKNPKLYQKAEEHDYIRRDLMVVNDADVEEKVKATVNEALDSQMGSIFEGRFALVHAFDRGLMAVEHGMILYFPEDTLHSELKKRLSGTPAAGQVYPVDLERDRVARWMERVKAAFAPEPLAAVSWLRHHGRQSLVGIDHGAEAKVKAEAERRLRGLAQRTGKSLDVYGCEKLPLSIRLTVVEERNHVWVDRGDVLVEDGVAVNEAREGRVDPAGFAATAAAAAAPSSHFTSFDSRPANPPLACDSPPSPFKQFALDHAGTTACVFALPLPVRRGERIELVADGHVVCGDVPVVGRGAKKGGEWEEEKEEPEDTLLSLVLSFVAGNMLEALIAIAVGREMEEFGVQPGERGWHAQQRRMVRRSIPPQLVLLFFEDVQNPEHAGRVEKRNEEDRNEWNMRHPSFSLERAKTRLEEEVVELMQSALKRTVKLLYNDYLGNDGRFLGEADFISSSVESLTALKMGNVDRVSQAGLRLCVPSAPLQVPLEQRAGAASNSGGAGGALRSGAQALQEGLVSLSGVASDFRRPISLCVLTAARKRSEEAIAEREAKKEAEAVKKGVDGLICILRQRPSARRFHSKIFKVGEGLGRGTERPRESVRGAERGVGG
uniref:Uncharacterized protein n=1 Tax=Chromera velia CCMP2878 TaxID=1169474 RepID=A0A0G4HJW6_9ALVE|eukprot:Cvel_28413.t1-p1 / transcript=Cvel_28413.t1 / gene=Cvel_28413 / organism=Chromera_velia_CCMP2878 / gene_product=hypothetical protein / transcript_product=hypothetical protein / location=Cvel_scaffold3714:3790-7960(-) / protein_length=684 / sequence_SO=supercontig / SO=protein_coding / is_pseudo=false